MPAMAMAGKLHRRHHHCLLLLLLMILPCLQFAFHLVDAGGIPTTLDGPFTPATRAFDRSLRQGSDDVPLSDPRLAPRARPPSPEQIALAASADPTSLWVSWVTGRAQVGSHLTPLDPAAVRSEVWYGERPASAGHHPHLATGSAEVYSQLYPFPGLVNYTSGVIHHVRLVNLRPSTRYYYRCGDSSLLFQGGLSDEHSFRTLPAPAPGAYPRRIAVVGDLGLTGNSTSTVEHLARNDPSLILMVGDMVYADQYRTTGGTGVSCFSCSFPDDPIRESYQPRWDGWGRFMEPLASRIPMMVIEGNHEIEPQGHGGAVTFASYSVRFAVPSEESGSNTKFYYSFDAGGIHFIMLGSYVDYNRTGAQYSWLKKDLQRVDRGVTPWVVASWHAPWYNSYASHYQEFECMRQEMEGLLYQHRLDIVFSGHVHAYERMNRVFNYTLDTCAPVYITIGDGGNIERIDIDHADDHGKCPSPGDNHPEFGGVCHLNFSSGPAKGKFCWERQPEWSAFRESSFGHGILEVVNSTYALWTWHRNQDTYGEDIIGDQIYITGVVIMYLASVVMAGVFGHGLAEHREIHGAEKAASAAATKTLALANGNVARVQTETSAGTVVLLVVALACVLGCVVFAGKWFGECYHRGGCTAAEFSPGLLLFMVISFPVLFGIAGVLHGAVLGAAELEDGIVLNGGVPVLLAMCFIPLLFGEVGSTVTQWIFLLGMTGL